MRRDGDEVRRLEWYVFSTENIPCIELFKKYYIFVFGLLETSTMFTAVQFQTSIYTYKLLINRFCTRIYFNYVSSIKFLYFILCTNNLLYFSCDLLDFKHLTFKFKCLLHYETCIFFTVNSVDILLYNEVLQWMSKDSL